jgi:hypothetical protein
MKRLLAFPAILIGIQAMCMAQTVAPGSEIQIRAATPFTVSMWDRGRVYSGFVARDVYGPDGYVSIPRGSPAEFTVRQINPDHVALEVESVTVDGSRYIVDSTGPLFTIDGYDNSSRLVRTMMDSLVGAEGTDVDVVARGNTVRVTGGAVISFLLGRVGVLDQYRGQQYRDQEYRYQVYRDSYR